MIKRVIIALAMGAVTTIGGLIAKDAYEPIKWKVLKVCKKFKKKTESK